MASTAGSTGAGGNPWAWLGLLKWSLSYSDGTKPSDTTMSPLSDEDKAFLEAVMKDGVIDENERMKTILKEVTDKMDSWRTEKFQEETAEEVEILLDELRFIVEQIDYARAFSAMKGLEFLLGCAQEREHIPMPCRSMCLGIIATMCQHNPPVQKSLLELGSLKVLSDLYYNTDIVAKDEDNDGQFRARIIQAISANVRSHELAEDVFCQLEQAANLIELGIGINPDMESTPKVLRKRSIFFLHALITSDTSSRQRVRRFVTSIAWILDNLLENSEGGDDELTEMSLALVEQVLEQKKSVNVILSRKEFIVATAIKRISSIRILSGNDREFADTELKLWESILNLIARASEDGPEPTLPMLSAIPAEDQNEVLPQQTSIR